MKKHLLILSTIFIISIINVAATYAPTQVDIIETIDETKPSISVSYTSLGVPDINSSFKTYMDYRAVTSRTSPQYKYIRNWGWCDENGFMRANGEKDLGVFDDYYMIALGSYYGSTIGTKYKITTNTGNIFYGVLCDQKDNRHTNSTNQYVPKNGNVVEFIVDTKQLRSDVKRMGTANVYMPLNGSITTIEKIEFVENGG